MDDIHLPGLEHLADAGGDLGCDGQGRASTHLKVTDDAAGMDAAQLVAGLATDGQHLDVLAGGQQRVDLLTRGAHDDGVETARQTPIRRGDHHQMALIRPRADQQLRGAVAGHARRQIGDHGGHALGIGP